MSTKQPAFQNIDNDLFVKERQEDNKNELITIKINVVVRWPKESILRESTNQSGEARAGMASNFFLIFR